MSNDLVMSEVLKLRAILEQHGYSLYRCYLLKDQHHPSLEVCVNGEVSDVVKLKNETADPTIIQPEELREYSEDELDWMSK